MGDFDESKITRDQNGRFSSGAEGFVAKHTGQIPKLEGYSGGGLDKWAGKVSGRTRDIEVPLISKSGERIVSSGQMSGDIKLFRGATDVSSAAKMVSNLLGTVHRDKIALEKEALKAHNAFERAVTARTDARTKLENEMDEHRHWNLRAQTLEKMANGKTLTDNEEHMRQTYIKIGSISGKFDGHLEGHEISRVNEALINARKGAEEHQAAAIAAEKAKNKAEASLEKKSEAKKEVFDKLGIQAGKYQALQAGVTLMREHIPSGFPGHTFEVSHSPSEGWVQLHIKGESKDPNYPGEKELSVVFNAGRAQVNGITKRGTSYTAGPKHKEMQLELTSQLPTDRKGKSHPDQVEISHPITTTFGPVANTHEHIKKFLTI